jgi:hypothetical protein
MALQCKLSKCNNPDVSFWMISTLVDFNVGPAVANKILTRLSNSPKFLKYYFYNERYIQHAAQ